MISLVWMRRDLRLDDHAALATALADRAPLQPVFVFDTEILARFTNPDDRRLSFIAATLCRIDAELRTRGGHLMVLHGKPAELLPKLARVLRATGIFSAEDFEPATRARDKAVKGALPATTRFVQVTDHVLRAPTQVVKGDGTAYKVFTPYYKVWRGSLGPTDWAEYAVKDAGRYADPSSVAVAMNGSGIDMLDASQGPEKLLAAIGYRYHADPIWTVDDVPARLEDFITQKLARYPTARDVMAIHGTSRLSPYLRHGLVSIRACMRAAMAQGGGEKWTSELAWREFYAAILYHFPEVVKLEFEPKYRGTLPWTQDQSLIDAFTQGRTGYPIVDAAVRELLTTGTMHNRARMIVASFAVKDLLIDWRVGEEFFAQHLMDYDLASNNGGWQWAASTGTDAAPYFRVFNPTLQSQKFDPKGEYLRRFLPELASMSDKDIHAPWLSKMQPKAYPAPMIDHAAARDRVIEIYRKASTLEAQE